MKKFFYLLLLVPLIGFTACSKNDDIPTYSFETVTCKSIIIDTDLSLGTSATYQWDMESAPSKTYSLTNTTAEQATFIASAAGVYKLKLTTTTVDKTEVYIVTVTVKEPATPVSPYISKVYDILPAVGQFTNTLPEYAPGDTKENIITKAENYIVGKKNGGLISLGGFGGYITFGFDHTIVNVKGKRDLRIMGNAFYADNNPNPNALKGGNCEPGIIMVAYDANNNGKPDDNEWYEIAGSEYYKSTTIKNYEITYYRPVSEEATPVDESHTVIKDYIRWEDNQGNSGYKEKNKYHSQSYYPSWIKEDRITFKGTLLKNNGIDESGNGSLWVLYALGYGYSDNVINSEDDSAIDISWAVDSNGKKVELPGIDFVKIYTGINQECGWIGETSTEIAGAYDLHLLSEDINTL